MDFARSNYCSDYKSIEEKNRKKESEWVLSRVQLYATPRTVAHEPPLSMGFSRQESWSWLPFPLPGDLPNPGIAPMSPAFRGDCLLLGRLSTDCLLLGKPQKEGN